MEVDNDEDLGLSDLDPGPEIPGVYEIVYVDASANLTRRKISRCQPATHGERSYLLAHCHLRDMQRLFRVDRIAELTDAETGEVLSRVSDVPIGGATAMAAIRNKELRAELNVLVFVATLSAGMRDSQIAIIAGHLRGLGWGGDPAPAVKRFKSPNPVDFREWIKQVPACRSAALYQAAVAVLAKVKRNDNLDRGVLEAILKWSAKPAAGS